MAQQCTEAYGGGSGTRFIDDLAHVAELRQIIIRSGDFIDSVQAVWQLDDGSLVHGPAHGGMGGDESVVDLQEGEVITRITGRYHDYLDQITFYTNKRRVFGPYGGMGGVDFQVTRLRLVGFHGAAHDFVDRLGFLSAPATRRKKADQVEVELTAEKRPRKRRPAEDTPSDSAGAEAPAGSGKEEKKKPAKRRTPAPSGRRTAGAGIHLAGGE